MYTKQNKKKQNKQGENGRFTRCYFRAEILQIDKFWTQMILAGNQSKQRGALLINLKNQDGGVFFRQSFLVKYVPFRTIVI